MSYSLIMHELQKRAIEVIERTYDLAWEKLRIKLPYPKVTFDLTGTIAGVAYPTLNKIRLNNRFLFNNTEAFLRRTTIHESAHCFAYQRYGDSIRPHGDEFKSIMMVYDAPTSACHNYLDNSVGRKPLTFQTSEGIVTYQGGIRSLEIKL